MYKSIYNNINERSLTTYPWVFWDGAFTSEQIDQIKVYCDRFQKDEATIIGEQDLKATQKVRISTVKFFHRNDETGWIFDVFNDVIFKLNERFYNYNINGYDAFQYTEYDCEKLGKYDWHQDMLHGENTIGLTRKLSVVMNLTEPDVDYWGGSFQINDGREEEPKIVSLPKGRIIVFPSYMIHRVTPVMRGIRKSIVIWVAGPKFI